MLRYPGGCGTEEGASNTKGRFFSDHSSAQDIKKVLQEASVTKYPPSPQTKVSPCLPDHLL